MTPAQRWQDIDPELAELWQGTVVLGDPFARDAELLGVKKRFPKGCAAWPV